MNTKEEIDQLREIADFHNVTSPWVAKSYPIKIKPFEMDGEETKIGFFSWNCEQKESGEYYVDRDFDIGFDMAGIRWYIGPKEGSDHIRANLVCYGTARICDISFTYNQEDNLFRGIIKKSTTVELVSPEYLATGNICEDLVDEIASYARKFYTE